MGKIIVNKGRQRQSEIKNRINEKRNSILKGNKKVRKRKEHLELLVSCGEYSKLNQSIHLRALILSISPRRLFTTRAQFNLTETRIIATMQKKIIRSKKSEP
jgi:hypothetical protein